MNSEPAMEVVGAEEDGSSPSDALEELLFVADDRGIPVTVEVRLKDTSTVKPELVKEAVQSVLSERQHILYVTGPVDLSTADGGAHPVISKHVQSARICDADAAGWGGKQLLLWQCDLQVHVYQAVVEDGPAEDDSGEDGVPAFSEWLLPNAHFDGLWDTLYYDSAIKQRLIRYAASALLFSERRVDPNLVSWNRVVLLHGPPGTGKTSLCKALAHKLAVRFSENFRSAALVEVNAHSLFSKWFSESGKQVSKLFSKITELLEEPDVLVFVLIDEIESLAAARKASGGSEPSDAVRAVNALLTQIDQLKRFPNVMVLTTSNITTAIDVAFVDRADIKAYIGPPTLAARYEMLRTSLQELGRAGVVRGEHTSAVFSFQRLQSLVSAYRTEAGTQPVPLQGWSGALAGVSGMDEPDTLVRLTDTSELLLYTRPDPCDELGLQLSGRLLLVAHVAEGLSGRALRKLPFLAHALQQLPPPPCSAAQYINAMRTAAVNEQKERRMSA